VLVTVPHGGATRLINGAICPTGVRLKVLEHPNTLILACKKILNLVLNLAIYPVLVVLLRKYLFIGRRSPE